MRGAPCSIAILRALNDNDSIFRGHWDLLRFEKRYADLERRSSEV